MSNQTETEQRLQELVRLLETYGSDKSRWPAADRLRMSSFIAIDPHAKAALAQAAALDRLLDMAPRVDIGRERALSQRILAAAASIGPASQTANIVQFPGTPKPAPSFLRSRTGNAAAALLAASLMLGIFAGTTRQLSSAFDLVADAVGLSDEESELAFYSEPATTTEESL